MNIMNRGLFADNIPSNNITVNLKGSSEFPAFDDAVFCYLFI